MRIGMFFRNFGPAATLDNLAACAAAAEQSGLDDLWVSDHVAIPPEESEGSGGLYLDPLATLGFLAGCTQRIGLGTSVLIVPYRPALVTAKWLATIQELSGERLTVGAAVGWMESEFRAVGVEKKHRGAITDETLAFWHECFANDELERNGQRFIFKPRPTRPRILIGGAAPHALKRAVALGDGWMPTGCDPEQLKKPIAELRQRMADAGKPAPQVVPLAGLPMDSSMETAERLAALAEIGVTGISHAGKYADAMTFSSIANALLEARGRAGLSA